MIEADSAVYWRRRAVAGAGVVGVVLLVVWALSGNNSNAEARPESPGTVVTAGATQLTFQPPKASDSGSDPSTPGSLLPLPPPLVTGTASDTSDKSKDDKKDDDKKDDDKKDKDDNGSSSSSVPSAQALAPNSSLPGATAYPGGAAPGALDSPATQPGTGLPASGQSPQLVPQSGVTPQAGATPQAGGLQQPATVPTGAVPALPGQSPALPGGSSGQLGAQQAGGNPASGAQSLPNGSLGTAAPNLAPAPGGNTVPNLSAVPGGTAQYPAQAVPNGVAPTAAAPGDAAPNGTQLNTQPGSALPNTVAPGGVGSNPAQLGGTATTQSVPGQPSVGQPDVALPNNAANAPARGGANLGAPVPGTASLPSGGQALGTGDGRLPGGASSAVPGQSDLPRQSGHGPVKPNKPPKPEKPAKPMKPIGAHNMLTAAPTIQPPTPAGAATCSDDNIGLVAQVSAPSFKLGQRPEFRLVIANLGSAPCSRDLDPGLQELQVSNASGARMWSSNDCDAAHHPQVRVLDPKKPVSFALSWAARSSAPGCAAKRADLPAGAYHLVGKLGPLTSGAADFTLTK